VWHLPFPQRFYCFTFDTSCTVHKVSGCGECMRQRERKNGGKHGESTGEGEDRG
jgi:hypothetical protein